jgi:hypothetical protein
MSRDAADWSEQIPPVEDTGALRLWLDRMPAIESGPSRQQTAPTHRNDEPPAPAVDPSDEEQQRWDAWAQSHVAVARDETQRIADILAEIVGRETGQLKKRVRELELQISYESRIRKLEEKIDRLSADLDADHSRAVAPVIPLRGAKRNNAA